MTDNRPKKVECLTCHGQHAYRAKEPGSRGITREAKTQTDIKEKKAPMIKVEIMPE